MPQDYPKIIVNKVIHCAVASFFNILMCLRNFWMCLFVGHVGSNIVRSSILLLLDSDRLSPKRIHCGGGYDVNIILMCRQSHPHSKLVHQHNVHQIMLHNSINKYICSYTFMLKIVIYFLLLNVNRKRI